MRVGYCENCLFWRIHPDSTEPDEYLGECRRHPPKETEIDREFVPSWHNDWCGEFQVGNFELREEDDERI